MNNSVVVESDSSYEDAEQSRQDRTESASRGDVSRRSYTSSELCPDDSSEDLNKNEADYCWIYLQYFDHNTSCLPCGHLFHHHCICTMDGQLRVGECPLCKCTLGPFEEVTRLFFDPNGLGSELADNLRRSNRRLEKQNRKLVSKHQIIKEELEEKCRHVYAQKTLIGSMRPTRRRYLTANRLVFRRKKNTRRYSSYVLKKLTNVCMHVVFLRAVRYLGRGPRFAENCQRIISAANKTFIRHVVRDCGEAVNGYSFSTFLSFWKKKDEES